MANHGSCHKTKRNSTLPGRKKHFLPTFRKHSVSRLEKEV